MCLIVYTLANPFEEGDSIMILEELNFKTFNLFRIFLTERTIIIALICRYTCQKLDTNTDRIEINTFFVLKFYGLSGEQEVCRTTLFKIIFENKQKPNGLSVFHEKKFKKNEYYPIHGFKTCKIYDLDMRRTCTL